MSDRLGGRAVVAALVAAGLGLASAAMSAYWALGGTGLLDTVGGEIERWGRERWLGVVVTLWVIVVLKLVGAAAPLAFAGVGADHLPIWTRGRQARLLGWMSSVGLTLYGALLTVAGFLVEAGALEASDDADERALAWHAYLWDPWFALWGAAFAVVMWCTRPQESE
jgi:Protein of unknown function (DUF3995)